MKISSQSFNLLIIIVIIFSNSSFGKEFNKLFEITTPVDKVSNIDNAINKSFNDLILRLTGTKNSKIIKSIAPSLKAKKDFLISYESINIDEVPYLVSRFNKDSLIQKLDNLNISVIGYDRPIVLLLIRVEDGYKDPYILNTSSNSDFDKEIKNLLKNTSNQRGIFFELPVFDLEDMTELSNITIFDSEEAIILPNYQYDFLIKFDISQTIINKWTLTGDIQSKEPNSLAATLQSFNKTLSYLSNDFLSSFKIPDQESSVKVVVHNINSYEDLSKLQDVLNRFLSIKKMSIKSYIDNSITYTFDIKGSLESFRKEINSNSLLQLIDIDENVTFISLSN
tara:strand:+ start:1306 stop:2319 length:1014 start_codon:yes stop_codon:yes gene_type:complete